jgi:hypothetical protein
MVKSEIQLLRDRDLVRSFERSVLNERETTRVLLLHLDEIDLRRLYAQEGYSSLIEWLIKKWRFSESSAYRRVQASVSALRACN